VVKAGGESTLTVLVAFGANLAIATAKTAAAAVSGSASMLAEAAHSWADTGNEVFLLIANRRSVRPADPRRPLGYGREAYVWSLLAAIGLFVVGASVSIWHGVTELIGGEEVHGRDYTLAYAVLAISFVLEVFRFCRRSGNCAPKRTVSSGTCSPTRWRRRIRPCARSSPKTPQR